MAIIKKILLYSLLVLSTGLIVLTLLSLIHDLRFWYYKVLDSLRLKYLLLRPLDHYFVTEEFGSDHYPIYARFVLAP
jgi:endonuclease/exonuclease/phosphatase (EEP) superfamily protein YafD